MNPCYQDAALWPLLFIMLVLGCLLLRELIQAWKRGNR